MLLEAHCHFLFILVGASLFIYHGIGGDVMTSCKKTMRKQRTSVQEFVHGILLIQTLNSFSRIW